MRHLQELSAKPLQANGDNRVQHHHGEADRIIPWCPRAFTRIARHPLDRSAQLPGQNSASAVRMHMDMIKCWHTGSRPEHYCCNFRVHVFKHLAHDTQHSHISLPQLIGRDI